jgi:DNA-binding MarR family transcriptional regulator
VVRESSRQDARRSEIALTPAGRALLARSGPTMQVRLADGLTRLSDEQRHQLVEGLEAWLRATGLEEEEATLFFEDGASRE